VISLNTLEELALAAIRTGAPHFVVCSRQPARGIATALAQANRRFVAVLDEPRAAVHDLVTRPGYDLVAATRVVASSCASLFSYVGMPGALVLSAARDGRDPVSTEQLHGFLTLIGDADRVMEKVLILERLRALGGVLRFDLDAHVVRDRLRRSRLLRLTLIILALIIPHQFNNSSTR